MAKTYYGYVEREADSYIDWGAIGKEMSDTLLEVNRVREEKKQAIDKASTDYVNYLSTAPQGEDKSANEWALDFSDNASQYLRQLDVALKSGRMSLKEYTVRKQNLIDDTKSSFELLSDYQKKFKDKMDRYKNGESQYWEQASMADAEGFGDFTKTGLYINPNTGKISIAKKTQGADGVFTMSDNPNEVMSVGVMKSLLLGEWNRFNAEDATTAIAKTNGAYKTAIMKQNSNIKTTEDVLNNPKFQEAETNILNATLANPWDMLSVLTDYKKFAPNGEQYRFTSDESDTAEEAILMVVDPKSGTKAPQFRGEQSKEAVEWLRTESRRKYDYTETIQALPDKQQRMFDLNAANWQKQQAEENGLVNAWNDLLLADTPQGKRNAADAVLASQQAQQLGLIGITFNGDDVELTYADSNKNVSFPWKDSSGTISLIEWARKGREIHNVLDEKKLLQGKTPNLQGSVDAFGIVSKRQGPPPPTTTATVDDNTDYKTALSNSLSSISPQTFKKYESEVAPILKAVLEPYGIQVEPSGDFIENWVYVTVPGKKRHKARANAWTDDGADDAYNDLIDYLDENLPNSESIKSLIKGGGEGGRWNPRTPE